MAFCLATRFGAHSDKRASRGLKQFMDMHMEVIFRRTWTIPMIGGFLIFLIYIVFWICLILPWNPIPSDPVGERTFIGIVPSSQTSSESVDSHSQNSSSRRLSEFGTIRGIKEVPSRATSFIGWTVHAAKFMLGFSQMSEGPSMRRRTDQQTVSMEVFE